MLSTARTKSRPWGEAGMLMRSSDPQGMEAACAALRAAGVSVTLPRLAVWTVLTHAEAPLPVADISRRLVKRSIQVSLSAVYAALKYMEAAGLLSSQVFSDGKLYFDLANRLVRNRVTCVETGTEHWLDDGDFAQHVAALCSRHGFELHDYTLSIQARHVIRAPAEHSAGRRTPRPAHSKDKVPLRQGGTEHEDAIPSMLSDTG